MYIDVHGTYESCAMNGRKVAWGSFQQRQKTNEMLLPNCFSDYIMLAQFHPQSKISYKNQTL